MTIVTRRADFERLIDLRMAEAKLLIDHGNWDGAYYLAGYAVEFALKVKIIALVMQSNSFPDRKLAENFYKHDLGTLRRFAELDIEMDRDALIKPQWEIVSAWSEQSRYDCGKAEVETRECYEAIASGVLPWIKARW